MPRPDVEGIDQRRNNEYVAWEWGGKIQLSTEQWDQCLSDMRALLAYVRELEAANITQRAIAQAAVQANESGFGEARASAWTEGYGAGTEAAAQYVKNSNWATTPRLYGLAQEIRALRPASGETEVDKDNPPVHHEGAQW